MEENVTSLRALFARDIVGLSNAGRKLLANAEVIFAYDISSGRRTLIYGQDLLMSVAESRKDTSAVILRVEVDMDSDDLDRLAAAVALAKYG